MSSMPHALGEASPDRLSAAHALKLCDPAFARLLADYFRVSDPALSADVRLGSISDDAEHALRKRRIATKDAIASDHVKTS